MSCHPHGAWNPEGAPQARKENLPNLRAEWYVLEEAKCLSTVLSVGPEFPLVEHKGNESWHHNTRRNVAQVACFFWRVNMPEIAQTFGGISKWVASSFGLMLPFFSRMDVSAQLHLVNAQNMFFLQMWPQSK